MDKSTERKILIKRFFWKDRKIYEIGKRSGITWFEAFERKFIRDEYAYFASDEKNEAIEKIATLVSDQKFIDVLNELGVDIIEIDRFIGEHYFFGTDGIFKLKDRRDLTIESVKGALKETGDRGYHFLKSIINLYKDGKWDRAYGGATWVDILAEIRRIGGKYPSPRDIALLKSYKIYFKTGSRRYPTHTIPEEIIPTIDSELERWNT